MATKKSQKNDKKDSLTKVAKNLTERAEYDLAKDMLKLARSF